MKKNLLEAKMKIYGDTQSDLATALGIRLSTFNEKLNGTHGCQFKQREIQIIKDRYNLTNEEVGEIFFD